MNKKMYINGQWVEGKEYYELRSPYNQELLARVPLADEKDVDRAIAAAVDSFANLKETPAHIRSQWLENIAQLIEERAEECARTISLETAKPITTSRVEINRTIQTYKFAAEEAKRIYGETIPLDAAKGGEGKMAMTFREPIGPVAAITPFNFPFNLVAHKVGPALALGNPVVLKPAFQTPLSALLLAEIIEKAGVPAGVVNVITGRGGSLGDALVTDPRIQMVTFTGSVPVGKAIRQKAGLKKTTLELGSNSAVIIDKDVDLDKCIPRCVTGAFSFSGQVCISLQRIYVHEEIFDAFAERFVESAEKLVMGDPLDERTEISAMISEKDVERITSWLEEAKEKGATVACGGVSKDNLVEPTVVLHTSADAKISCQEAFAPIVNINPVSSMDEAIEQVNDSQYGLQAGVFTTSVAEAMKAIRKLEVGGVIINDIPTFRVDHMPYGGVKESGTGREGIKYAVEEMTEIKLAILNP